MKTTKMYNKNVKHVKMYKIHICVLKSQNVVEMCENHGLLDAGNEQKYLLYLKIGIEMPYHGLMHLSLYLPQVLLY